MIGFGFFRFQAQGNHGVEHGHHCRQKNESSGAGFHRQMQFLEQEPQQEYHSRKSNDDSRCYGAVGQKSIQTEPQTGECFNGKEKFLETAHMPAYRQTVSAAFHSGKGFFSPLQVRKDCHKGIDQHHGKKSVAE